MDFSDSTSTFEHPPKSGQFHGYLHLTEENRSRLLQVSPTTADRLLHPHRTPVPRGFSLTQAGPLLKHQIPIRTFQQWNETQPGFVEADLVAHCGGHPEGSFLYTFTLTDVATGWTECLPLLSKSAEAVLFAFEQARVLFPFPILGLDVDNGGEFINQHLVSRSATSSITTQRSGDQQSGDPDQTVSLPGASRLQMEEQNARQVKHPALTIEQAIQWYLDEHKANERSPKTMEWHQTALGLFQQYLVSQRHLCLLSQITEMHARGWVAFLQTSPSAKDTTWASATIATYVHSARAFCHWGIRNGYLKRSPFVKGTIPQVGRKAIYPIEPDVFDRLLLACRLTGEGGLSLDRVAARNRSILWILMDQACGFLNSVDCASQM